MTIVPEYSYNDEIVGVVVEDENGYHHLEDIELLDGDFLVPDNAIAFLTVPKFGFMCQFSPLEPSDEELNTPCH